MILLVFHIGDDRYAVHTSRIVEVLPPLPLKAIPGAAPGICGLFNYHGAPVPVVDITAMTLGKSATRTLSTRIILLRYSTAGGQEHLLGMLAENATTTIRRRKEDFQPTGVTPSGAPFLGPVTRDERGLVQWVEPERLLTPQAREELWRQTEVHK